MATLAFTIRPSRWLQGYALITHGLALAVSLTLPLGLLLSMAVIVHGFWVRRQLQLRTATAICAATWTLNGWTLHDRAGRCLAATLSVGSRLTRWLIVLRFRCDDQQRRTLLLAPDSLATDEWRRLRVRLRRVNQRAK